MSLLHQLGCKAPAPRPSLPDFLRIPFQSGLPRRPQPSPRGPQRPRLSLTLGCRCPPISPLLSLGARSPPRWEPSCPDPARSWRPGSSARRRSAAPRAADAEPGKGSRSAGWSQLGYARASLRPRRRPAASSGQPNRNCFGGRGVSEKGRGQNRKGTGKPEGRRKRRRQSQPSAAKES